MSDILKEVVFQVLQKITIEDGDILVIRCNKKILSDLAMKMTEILPPKQILLVHESDVEFLNKVDEKKMNAIGWYRKENNADTP